MKTVIRRIARLEDRLAPKVPADFLRNPREHVRLVASAMDHDLNLETSTCRRTLTENGCLIEVVRLDGIRDGLSDEALDRFVASFPVEILGGGSAA
jgi:hypothetical protein